eukprot:TRINITY_DN20869_c0_g1_i9.p1 TRINITY_DN20869_c0_g1~~TRINITY_DN20869_c0_g1_i9.p1  ORF type:complete len:376 (-),score=103.44 TRINITY_DN20869_c0_g1_i9:32-1066(-)
MVQYYWRCDNRWYSGRGGWKLRAEHGDLSWREDDCWWRRLYLDKLEENIKVLEAKVDKMRVCDVDEYTQTQEVFPINEKLKGFEAMRNEKAKHMNVNDHAKTQEMFLTVEKLKEFEAKVDEMKVMLMKKMEDDNCWRWWSEWRLEQHDENGGRMHEANADDTMVASFEKLEKKLGKLEANFEKLTTVANFEKLTTVATFEKLQNNFEKLEKLEANFENLEMVASFEKIEKPEKLEANFEKLNFEKLEKLDANFEKHEAGLTELQLLTDTLRNISNMVETLKYDDEGYIKRSDSSKGDEMEDNVEDDVDACGVQSCDDEAPTMSQLGQLRQQTADIEAMNEKMQM